MQIAILGAGNVGGALGKALACAGHAIAYGVRDPADPRHAAAAAAAGNAPLRSIGAAIAGAEAIILAVPWDAVPEAVAACGDLAGRVLIDVTNPLTMGPEGLELALGFDRSGGETVAALAPGARVVKTLNQVGFQVMADAAGYAAPPVMFLAGEDDGAKRIAAGLLREIGFAPLDAGGIAVSRLLEPFAMLWIHMVYARKQPADAAFAFLRREG